MKIADDPGHSDETSESVSVKPATASCEILAVAPEGNIVSPSAGSPVIGWGRAFEFLMYASSLFGGSVRPRNGGVWLGRHSSRPRWTHKEGEPYVDLSPLDITRRR